MRTLLSLILCIQVSMLSNTLKAQSNLRFMSYNILEGFKNNSNLKNEFTKWVTPLNVDIIAFQETNEFTQHSLEQFAATYGHPYAVLSKESGYPVSVTSKHPIVNVQKVLDNMWHGYIYATIQDYHVFILHLSPHVQAKREHEMRQIIAHAQTLPKNAKIIFAGDFNSMSEVDAAHYPTSLETSMKLSEEKQKHIRNLKNGKIDYSVMKQMETAGFIDAYYVKNKSFKHSIPTDLVKTPTSYLRRIDFVIVSKNLAKKIEKVDIIHDEITDRISDHFPVIMDLK